MRVGFCNTEMVAIEQRVVIESHDLKKYLLRGGAWAFFGKLATSLVGLLVVSLLARILSRADMGLYFLAFNLATFFSIFGRGGLENTLLRYLAKANGANQPGEMRAIWRKGWVLTVCVASIAGLSAAIALPSLGESIFGSSRLSALAWLIGGWVTLLAIQGVAAEIFRGMQEIACSVWFGGLTAGMLTVALLAAAMGLGTALDLSAVILLILCALSFNAVVAFLAQCRKMKALPEAAQSKTGYGELLGHSWPLLINAVTLFLLSQSDLWLVGTYASKEAVAVYGAAARLVMLTAISLNIVNMVVPPLIATMHVQNDLARLERLLRSVATLAAIPALTILTMFMLFAAPMMELIYGEHYRSGAIVLMILSAGQIANVLTGSCGYVLIMTGHRKTIMAITITSAVFALSVGLYSVQAFGIIGLATAYTIAAVVQQVGMWIYAHHYLGVWTHAGVTYLLGLGRTIR